MVQTTGKFEHVSFSSDFEEYLKSMGTSEEFIKGVLVAKPIVTIEEATGDKLRIVTKLGERENVVSFKLGESYDDPRYDGSVAKSVTTRSGNTFNIETTLPDGRKQTKVIEFTEDGFNVKLSDKKSGKTATIVFKRV